MVLDFFRMRDLMKLEHRKQWDKQKVMANATKITTTLTGMPRGTDNHSKVEDGAIDMTLIDDYLDRIHYEQNELWTKVVPALKRYESEPAGNDIYKERNIIIFRARYEYHKTIEEIADSINLSKIRVIQILKQIESKVQDYT